MSESAHAPASPSPEVEEIVSATPTNTPTTTNIKPTAPESSTVDSPSTRTEPLAAEPNKSLQERNVVPHTRHASRHHEDELLDCENCGESIPYRDPSTRLPTLKMWDAHKAGGCSGSRDKTRTTDKNVPPSSGSVPFRQPIPHPRPHPHPHSSIPEMSPTSGYALETPPKRRRAKRTEEERIAYLRADPYIAQFEAYKVLCASCDKWIRLRPNSTYCSIPWDAHRKSCLNKRANTKNPSAMEERNSFFSKDPDIRKFDSERVLCAGCDRWVSITDRESPNGPNENPIEGIQRWLQHRTTCSRASGSNGASSNVPQPQSHRQSPLQSRLGVAATPARGPAASLSASPPHSPASGSETGERRGRQHPDPHPRSQSRSPSPSPGAHGNGALSRHIIPPSNPNNGSYPFHSVVHAIGPNNPSASAFSGGGLHNAATSVHESRRRSALARQQTLLSDPLIRPGCVEPNRVFCSLCSKWVQLRQDSSYCAYPWLQHRGKCLVRHQRRARKTEAESEDVRSVPRSTRLPAGPFSIPEHPPRIIAHPLGPPFRHDPRPYGPGFQPPHNGPANLKRSRSPSYSQSSSHTPPAPVKLEDVDGVPAPEAQAQEPPKKKRRVMEPNAESVQVVVELNEEEADADAEGDADPDVSAPAPAVIVSGPGISGTASVTGARPRRGTVSSTGPHLPFPPHPTLPASRSIPQQHAMTERQRERLPSASSALQQSSLARHRGREYRDQETERYRERERERRHSLRLQRSEAINVHGESAHYGPGYGYRDVHGRPQSSHSGGFFPTPTPMGPIDLDTPFGRKHFISISISYLFSTTFNAHTDQLSMSTLLTYLNAAIPQDKWEEFDTREVVKIVGSLASRDKERGSGGGTGMIPIRMEGDVIRLA